MKTIDFDEPFCYVWLLKYAKQRPILFFFKYIFCLDALKKSDEKKREKCSNIFLNKTL